MRKNWKEKLRDDIAVFRALPGPERKEFLWDYYRVPIIAAVCVLALLVITVALGTGREDTLMYAVFINADENGDAGFFRELLRDTAANPDGKQVDVDARYSLSFDGSSTDGDTMMVLAALFGVGDLDVFAADEPVFALYADKDAFVDLSLFIPREELDRLPLYLHTDETGHEIVAGLRLSEGSPLHRSGFYRTETILGVAALAQNLDPAVEFMKQLVNIL